MLEKLELLAVDRSLGHIRITLPPHTAHITGSHTRILGLLLVALQFLFHCALCGLLPPQGQTETDTCTPSGKRGEGGGGEKRRAEGRGRGESREGR